MRLLRVIVLFMVILLSALLALGILCSPQVRTVDAAGFSAERVVRDIAEFAHSHHSVAHPEERAKVRKYLLSRLESFAPDRIEQFEYKGLEGPDNKHVKYTFDAVNILAEFLPEGNETVSAELLLVAHYDSRYSQPMHTGDTVWSYGAADDGYGIGVILEILEQALSFRGRWKQGIKVLFTDAEEPGMKGMKAMWEHDREEFRNVGLVMNMEARGPWGPVLLFETSAGNERIMELYGKKAKWPFTYSLTTVVYSIMPNYTDFTILKDELPGLNFSTVADINHYHTDLDNLDNVNTRTIQHYGEQVMPVVEEYLCNSIYADREYLHADRNTVSFTIPAIGLFNFSKTAYLWLNMAVYLIFLLLLIVDVLHNRVFLGSVLRYVPVILAVMFAVFGIGLLSSYLCCLVAGVPFKLFGIVQGIPFDNTAMLVLVSVMILVTSICYFVVRCKQKACYKAAFLTESKHQVTTLFAISRLYSIMLLLLVLSAVLLFTLGENIMFFIPSTIAVIVLFLCRVTRMRLWLVLGIGVILLHAISFLFALAMALTIGAFALVLTLAFLDTLLVLPLADLYVTSNIKSNKIK